MQQIARYVSTTLLALVTLIMVPACDTGSADREAVRDAIEQYYTAYAANDGAKVVGLVTNSTIRWYDRMLSMGRDGTAQQIANLTSQEKWEILMMRNRNTKAQIKDMDGRAYFIHATSKGYYVNDDVKVDLPRIRIMGTTAIAPVTIDGEDSDLEARFFKEDGSWKIDETTLYPVYCKWIELGARFERMTVEQFLIATEEDETGKKVRSDIWDRMR